MTQQEAIAEIEREARNSGFSIRAVCERANVHPTTFSRWKKTVGNPQPQSAKYNDIQKIRAALAELIGERKAEGKAVAA